MVEPWDYLILTAANDVQAAAYRVQLEVRRRLQLLGNVREVLVVADPDGRRVGSGGSTLWCLLEVLNRELTEDDHDRASPKIWAHVLQRLRVLIIHAGGSAWRSPAYGGSCGNTFIPLPLAGDSALGSTLFDRQLPTYLALPLPAEHSGQVVIASGDVLLGFQADEARLASTGMTGLACAATAEQASRHGVYCLAPDGRVRQFLQKPSPLQQAEHTATDSFGRAMLDIGVINFDAATAIRLLTLCRPRMENNGKLAFSGPIASAILSEGLDFYREICCALGTDTTLDRYRSAVRGSGSSLGDDLLAEIFQTLSGIPYRAQVLSRCDFLHFGTARQMIASGQQLRHGEDSFTPVESCLSINNRFSGQGELVGQDAWVEGCSISSRLTLPGDNVVVGVDVHKPLELPPRACLEVLPGRSRSGQAAFFVRCCHEDDQPLRLQLDEAAWCGHPLESWLQWAQAKPEDVWDPGLPPQRRSACSARLFPLEKHADGYRRWLWLFEPQGASPEQFRAWRAADRYSFEEMADLADREAFCRRRTTMRSEAIRRSLRLCFHKNSNFSASDLAYIFQESGEPGGWLADLLLEARRHRESSPTASAEEAFVLPRIMHTLGSALSQYAGNREASLGDVVPGVETLLQPAEVEWLAEWDLSLDSHRNVHQWAARARATAFELHRGTILGGGEQFDRPLTNALRSDEIIWGRAPARLDLAGGWTDTPPFTLEHGGCVLNAAVELNGQPPIQVHARVVSEPLIRLRSIDTGTELDVRQWDQLLDYASAAGAFSLVKAALVISGFSPRPSESSSLRETLLRFGGGIELTTLAAIPKGSGLGTSSILGAVLLAVIHRLIGRPLSPTELFHAVLRLEQAMTTGGGWQDQIGGSVGGLKLITTMPGLVPEASIRYVPCDVLDPRTNGGQTRLYYTGITRLAKNILQQVVGRYLDRDRHAMDTLRQIHGLAPEMAEALARKDVRAFGHLVDRAWQLNKQLDPNSTNEQIERLLDRIRPFIHGAKLLGAGGGGFLLMVCKSSEEAARMQQLLESDPPNPRARFFNFAVSPSGLDLSVC